MLQLSMFCYSPYIVIKRQLWDKYTVSLYRSIIYLKSAKVGKQEKLQQNTTINLTLFIYCASWLYKRNPSSLLSATTAIVLLPARNFLIKHDGTPFVHCYTIWKFRIENFLHRSCGCFSALCVPLLWMIMTGKVDSNYGITHQINVICSNDLRGRVHCLFDFISKGQQEFLSN